MSTNAFAAAYLESKVLTASPLQLVCQAYESTIEAVVKARGHLNQKRIRERSDAITRAQLILVELQSALDFQQGGAISVQLKDLYAYMLRRLAEANFKQVEEPLADVQGLLETLVGAWREIAVNGTVPAITPQTDSLPPATNTETRSTEALESVGYSPSPSSAYGAVETPAYQWSGDSAYANSAYAHAAYNRSEYTL